MSTLCHRLPLIWLAVWPGIVVSTALAGGPEVVSEQQAAASIETTSVEELVSVVRDSIVTIRHTGRDGDEQGLGTGFVIDADGLIATNLHVIGEGRPIRVQLADGSQHEVTASMPRTGPVIWR